MTRPVVAVTGFWDDRPPGIERADAVLRFASDDAALAEALAGADVMFAWGRRSAAALRPLWGSAGALRWIQSANDGVDSLLFPELVASEVVVTNAGDVFDAPIAEWVIGAITVIRTGLHRSILDTAQHRWDDDRRRERVEGGHLVIVGSGPIGRATARRARGLGLEVTLIGRRTREDDEFGVIGGPERLHAALATADHVLDALPLASGTERFFDAARFEAMAPGAVFVNVGRGGTVDESALREALRKGHLRAAALDVFDDEPLPADSPWWDTPNVIVSPHVCGDLVGWERAVVDLFCDNLERYSRGEPLRHVVDKAAGFPVG